MASLFVEWGMSAETETCWLRQSVASTLASHVAWYNALTICTSLINENLRLSSCTFTGDSEQQEQSASEAYDEPVSGSLEEKPRPNCSSARKKSSYPANHTGSLGEEPQE